MNREILSLRDPGVERLLVGLPDYAAPEKLEPTRRWARALIASVSRWEMDRRKRKSLSRGGRTYG